MSASLSIPRVWTPSRARPWARPAALTLAAIALQGFLLVGSYVAMGLAERSGRPIFGGLERSLIFADVPGYYAHACRAFEGQIPYIDDPNEYPPLALPFLFAPRLFGSSQSGFVLGFASLMLLAHAVTVALVSACVLGREGSTALPRRLLWMTLCVVAIGPILLGRFDAVPACLGFLSAWMWASRRPALGGLVSGLGTLVKIAPGAVALPALVLDARRHSFRGTLIFALTVALGVSLWLALAGRGALDAIQYHTGRGVEIGSVYSSVLWLISSLTGTPLTTSHDHSSTNLLSPWSPLAARLALPVQLFFFALVARRSRRIGSDQPFRLAAASMLAFAVTGKVLSPQYLLWVLPLVALVERPLGPSARLLFLTACLLTALLYPWTFGSLSQLETTAFLLLALRNALLVSLLFLLLFFQPTQARQALS